jgi:undecaprenyl-diphosphatase
MNGDDRVGKPPLPPPHPHLGTRAGLTLLVLSTAAFLTLVAILPTAAVERLDTWLLLATNRTASPPLDGFALEVTSLGSVWVVWVALLAVGALLWERRHRASVVLLWSAVVSGVVVNVMLKSLFGRGRPELFEWRTPYAGHFAFPSGHSMNAMIAYFTLALVLARVLPRGWARWLATAGCALAIALVGSSRVYLGVHYPSDVLGGYLAGLGWAAACALLVDRRMRREVEGRAPAR